VNQENLMEQLRLRYSALGIDSDTLNMEFESPDVQCIVLFNQYDRVLYM
jgi:hypothetical protein